MSLHATSYVLSRRFGNQIRKLLMIAIADFAGEDGRAWPSIDTLANRAECSRRSVQEHLNILVEQGELEIRPNAGRSGTNLYRIIFKKSKGREHPETGGDANPARVQMAAVKQQGGGANERRPSAPEPLGTVIEPSHSLKEGERESDEAIAQAIRGLRREWKLPLTSPEVEAIAASRSLFAGMIRSDWDALAAYLAARLPEGMPKWQPRSRLKFLQTAADAVSYALEWQRKAAARQPAPKPPAPPPGPPVSREELRELLAIRPRPESPHQ